MHHYYKIKTKLTSTDKTYFICDPMGFTWDFTLDLHKNVLKPHVKLVAFV